MNRDKLIGRFWDIVIVAFLLFCLILLPTMAYILVHFIRKFW